MSLQQEHQKKRRRFGTSSPLPSAGLNGTTEVKETMDSRGGLYVILPDHLFAPPLTAVNAIATGTAFIEADLPPQDARPHGHKCVQELLNELIAPGNDQDNIWKSKVRDKALMLDNPPAKKGHSASGKVLGPLGRTQQHCYKANTRVLNAKQQRLHHHHRDQYHSYAMYQPLHNLWKQYISDTMKGCSGLNLQAKLLKADLHGCIIQVVRSKCVSLVGEQGVIIQETEKTFHIVTPQDQLKVVAKKNAVFTFVLQADRKNKELGNIVDNNNKHKQKQQRQQQQQVSSDTALVVTLYGSNFLFRSSDRSARKFKYRPTIELV